MANPSSASKERAAKERAANSFGNLVRSAMLGPTPLTCDEMCMIILKIWRMTSTPQDVAAGNSPDVYLLKGGTDSDGKPVVMIRWGPMLAVHPPALAVAKGMAYFQAAEQAVTDFAVEEYFGQVPGGKELAVPLKEAITRSRSRFYEESADVAESQVIREIGSARGMASRIDALRQAMDVGKTPPES